MPATRVRSTSVVFPILLIAFGALMLLWLWHPNFYPWPVLDKYWPLFLILVGAGMLWDRLHRQRDPQSAPNFPIGSTIGTVLFLIVLAALLWRGHAFDHQDSRFVVSAGRAHDTKWIDAKGAKAARVSVQMPVGQLRVQGGAQHLLDADFYHGDAWQTPSIEYSVESGTGDLILSQDGGDKFATNSDNAWNLKLAENIPLDLEIDLGAGHGELNLARIGLSNLKVNIGAGQVNVDLTGERGKDLHAELHGGVGEATVRLPKNIGVVAVVHGGLGSIDVRGLKQEDGQYVNAAYGKSPNTLHLTVEGGIGQIKLEQE
jgi:N-terminal domain of toast_rack, DUF2154